MEKSTVKIYYYLILSIAFFFNPSFGQEVIGIKTQVLELKYHGQGRQTQPHLWQELVKQSKALSPQQQSLIKNWLLDKNQASVIKFMFYSELFLQTSQKQFPEGHDEFIKQVLNFYLSSKMNSSHVGHLLDKYFPLKRSKKWRQFRRAILSVWQKEDQYYDDKAISKLSAKFNPVILVEQNTFFQIFLEVIEQKAVEFNKLNLPMVFLLNFKKQLSYSFSAFFLERYLSYLNSENSFFSFYYNVFLKIHPKAFSKSLDLIHQQGNHDSEILLELFDVLEQKLSAEKKEVITKEFLNQFSGKKSICELIQNMTDSSQSWWREVAGQEKLSKNRSIYLNGTISSLQLYFLLKANKVCPLGKKEGEKIAHNLNLLLDNIIPVYIEHMKEHYLTNQYDRAWDSTEVYFKVFTLNLLNELKEQKKINNEVYQNLESVFQELLKKDLENFSTSEKSLYTEKYKGHDVGSSLFNWYLMGVSTLQSTYEPKKLFEQTFKNKIEKKQCHFFPYHLIKKSAYKTGRDERVGRSIIIYLGRFLKSRKKPSVSREEQDYFRDCLVKLIDHYKLASLKLSLHQLRVDKPGQSGSKVPSNDIHLMNGISPVYFISSLPYVLSAIQVLEQTENMRGRFKLHKKRFLKTLNLVASKKFKIQRASFEGSQAFATPLAGLSYLGLLEQENFYGILPSLIVD